MEEVMVGVIIALVLIILGSTVIAIYIHNSRIDQLESYWDIEIGMSEDEMLSIMGEGYNRSLLKNNRVKYEWRIEATSYGSSYKGMSARSYSGVKKVTIYIKNGYVEEVKPYNV